jgi:hypothetical protein
MIYTEPISTQSSITWMCRMGVILVVIHWLRDDMRFPDIVGVGLAMNEVVVMEVLKLKVARHSCASKVRANTFARASQSASRKAELASLLDLIFGSVAGHTPRIGIRGMVAVILGVVALKEEPWRLLSSRNMS